MKYSMFLDSFVSITRNHFVFIHLFFKQEMLELTEKPVEDHGEGSKNGLNVVEMEPEVQAVNEAESQLIPAEGVPVPESVTLLSNTDLQVPMKEDPAQSSQSESQLTSQDIRRAKRIRVSFHLNVTVLLCLSVGGASDVLYNSVSLFLNLCYLQRWMCR